ncbi:ParA family protein [Marinitoga sp. 1138]|uniref:ParA family protein n=1 Tax=Marinitoga sp. 1138 TaxID=1643334 RepID=UPI0015866985|nr:ParA family protein [Marinitoga sp. 1138]NUU96906.1 hypothetical protein [Marinitoga sp. 1138]
MAIKIVFSNRKGGSGKTTLAYNIASIVSEKHKTLLIDFDSQAHSSVYAGLNPFEVKYGIYEGIIDFIKNNTIKNEIITKNDTLDLIPANQHLAALEIELNNFEDKNIILKNFLIDIENNYDYIFIDTPPSLNLLTINALNAANYLIIPVKTDFLSLVGISQIMEVFYYVNTYQNPDIKLLGIIPTMVNKRLKITQEIFDNLTNTFGNEKILTPLRNDVKVIESSSHGIPVHKYAPKSRASSDLKKIAAEILKKVES